MTAIERITGFACEVNEEQWRELVKVADEVGVKMHTKDFDPSFRFIAFDHEHECLVGWHFKPTHLDLIPCPDFFAKLKGVEKWEPKNGEEVEVKPLNSEWMAAKYIGKDDRFYVCVGQFIDEVYCGFIESRIRPLRPTITRKEAEDKLNARIID